MADKYIFHSCLMPALLRPSGVQAVYDRTQQMRPCPEIVCLTPIGRADVPRKEFAALCAERAADIVNKAAGRRIHVSWSGGLDSTCTLLALMEIVVPSELTILMSAKSIVEYPLFYHAHVEGKMPVLGLSQSHVDATVEGIVGAGGVLVTGEIGDQVFGSIKFMEYADQADLLKPWDAVLEGVSEQTVTAYTTLAQACPRPITSVKDFWWWFNYTLKYQGVQLRMLLNSQSAIVEGNVFHFFDNEGFNDYAVYTDIEDKYPGIDPTKYKLPMKQYILDKTGDQDYYDHKTKERSLVIYRGRLADIFTAKAIDEQWNREY